MKTSEPMKYLKLDNCGVDDGEMAALLKGLVKSNTF